METSPPPPKVRTKVEAWLPLLRAPTGFTKLILKAAQAEVQECSPLQDTDLSLLDVSRFPAWPPEAAQPAHGSRLAQECLCSNSLAGFSQKTGAAK